MVLPASTLNCKRGKKFLKEHLANAPGNATYTSPTVQNRVIDITYHQIQHNILQKVKKGIWFIVVADVIGLSNRELLSLMLRYIHCDTGLGGKIW